MRDRPIYFAMSFIFRISISLSCCKDTSFSSYPPKDLGRNVEMSDEDDGGKKRKNPRTFHVSFDASFFFPKISGNFLKTKTPTAPNNVVVARKYDNLKLPV